MATYHLMMASQREEKGMDLKTRVQIAREHQFYEKTKSFLLFCVIVIIALITMGADSF
jgi:hypothetical protein